MDAARELLPEEAFSAFDRSYWLCRCEGFRVIARDGRQLGLVETLRFSAPGTLEALAVRPRAPAADLAFVPVEAIDEVRPLGEEIVLASSAPGS